jgi:hypothetical protein
LKLKRLRSRLEDHVNSQRISYRLLALTLRLALLLALAGGSWLVYKRLPAHGSTVATGASAQTVLQIVLQPPQDMGNTPRNIPVEISPVDIVAVRHEFFVEPRAGQRFDDFLQQRMNGRAPIDAKLDNQGRASLMVSAGNWWIHAVLSGEEDLEWRLPVTLTGGSQIVELTQQNAYTRSKSF